MIMKRSVSGTHSLKGKLAIALLQLCPTRPTNQKMDKKPAKLIIICGLPGSGKTTLAKKMSSELAGIRFCPDEWMEDLGVSLWDAKFRDVLEKRFLALTQDFLKNGQSVILEYGFWSKSERDQLLHLARSLNVGVELHYLDVPEDEIRRRLEKRGMEGDDVILDHKLKEWLGQFERPDDAELRLYDNYSANP